MSLASEPDEPKNTWFMLAGAISAIFWASSTGVGVEQRKKEL